MLLDVTDRLQQIFLLPRNAHQLSNLTFAFTQVAVVEGEGVKPACANAVATATILECPASPKPAPIMTQGFGISVDLQYKYPTQAVPPLLNSNLSFRTVAALTLISPSSYFILLVLRSRIRSIQDMG